MRIALVDINVAFALVVIAASEVRHEARADMVLGILQETADETKEGPKASTNLRLGFRREGHDWAPICQSKASPPWSNACGSFDADSIHRWRVFYEGHRIGDVATAGWLSETHYKDAGHLRVTSPEVPQRGSRREDFSGWSGVEVHRPLLAIDGATEGYRAWTAATVTAAEKALLFPIFVKSVPAIPSCKTDANDKPIGGPSRTRIGDVEILPGLVSSSNERLVGMRIKSERIKDCEQVGDVRSDHWYLISKGRKVHALDYGRDESEWSTTLRPIEVGNFDGVDGDEALFWYSGYNEDGYVLFYANFTKVARFTWGYH
jgi:hypothetical protein